MAKRRSRAVAHGPADLAIAADYLLVTDAHTVMSADLGTACLNKISLRFRKELGVENEPWRPDELWDSVKTLGNLPYRQVLGAVAVIACSDAEVGRRENRSALIFGWRTERPKEP